LVKNRKFKLALLARWDSQVEASKALGLQPSILSSFIRGYRLPSESELKKLRAVFTENQLKRYFGKSVEITKKIAGSRVVNE
jgi:hypothetical protein